MKKKSPITVEKIQFYTYNCDETDDLVFINQFPFDDRHDFLVDKNLAGLAVRIEVSNNRCDKGARRLVSLTLVDMTLRCEIASKTMKINLAPDDYRSGCIYFPGECSGLVGGHNYKLVACDETAGETLNEGIIHLLDKSVLGDPTEWYEICDGGVRPAWKSDLYKSVRTEDTRDYYVQFNVAPSLGMRLPAVMPELEVRIYRECSYGVFVKTFFREPFCHNRQNYSDNRWTVECPFETLDEINSVFYAELLCMDYPIAGFVFDTKCDNDVSGSWFGYEIEPMDEYSREAAIERIDEYLPQRKKSDSEDEFDKLLDDFISSVLQKREDAEPSEVDAAEDTDLPEDEDDEPKF